MSRYYHNENPQVDYWIKKCELLEKELDMVRKTTEENDERFRLTIKYWGASFEEICTKKDKLKEEMKSFNSLPWWRKMFFKFEI